MQRGRKPGKINASLNKKLEEVKWGEFKLDDLFNVLPVRNKLSKLDLSDSGNVPVYSSDTTNNGIIGFTSKEADYKVSNDTPIYFIFGDHTKSMNIATSNFCVMDNVKILIPFTHSLPAILFISAVWGKTIPNLGYARHWSKAKESVLMLPTSDGVNPYYEFMETFISELRADRITELETYLIATGLKDYTLTAEEQQVLVDFENVSWEGFNLEKLFGKSIRGKRLKSADRISGDLPFVTAGEKDEGVSAFIGNDVNIFSENTTTIDMFGSAKYRNYKYGADDHIAVVCTENLPKYASIFITTAIHKSSHTGKFNYGRNFYAKDADELNILLPTKSKKPNYKMMEIFISAIHKLVIKDVVLFASKK